MDSGYVDAFPVAVHRTIAIVDVEGFGDRARNDHDRLIVRAGLYKVLRSAFSDSGIMWENCHHEDRGDGVLILVAPDAPKSMFVESLPAKLVRALADHNTRHPVQQRIRLRAALHAGEINYDCNGIVSTAVNVTFRLLDSPELKDTLKHSNGSVALIVSSWFFDEVVRNSASSDFATYRPARVAVKETSTIGWIRLPDAPFPPTEHQIRSRGAPQQLVMAPTHFTGRTDELAALRRDYLHWDDGRLLYLITGPGGIGKTSLASRWLHEIAPGFADGALFADMRAFGQDPAEVLGHLLRSFGVPPDQIPMGTTERAALYRSVTTDKSFVMLVDDAATAAQVRWLLPGEGRSVVVVTARRKLPGLLVDGARFLPLQPLTHHAGLRLLSRAVGAHRIELEAEHAETLVDICGGMPLALAVVAAQLAGHPQWTLARLANSLKDNRTRLARLSIRRDFSVEAVLRMSYQELSRETARLYRSLGLHARPEFPLGIAAAAIGRTVNETGDLIEELVDANLVDEVGEGRFRLHDLMHLYAKELAEAEDSLQERDVSVRRIAEWYLRGAISADELLRPGRRRLHYDFLDTPSQIMRFSENPTAMRWLEIELNNIVATTRQALDDGRFELAWHLCDAMWPLRYRVDHLSNVLVCQLGIRAARTWHNLFAEARMTYRLGIMLMQAGELDSARTHMQRALALREQIGDERGATNVREDLAVLVMRSNPEKAVQLLTNVLVQKERQGNPRRIGRTLLNLGRALLAAGDVTSAITHLQQAVQRFSVTKNDPYNDLKSATMLGRAYLAAGQQTVAAEYLQASLAHAGELGARFAEAEVHEELAHLYFRNGEVERARIEFRLSADLLEKLSVAEARRVRIHLQSIAGQDG